MAAIKTFTDMELFEMFNVDITPDAPHKDGDKSEYEEYPYAFNDIKCHLWSMHKRQLSRGEREALLEGDLVKDGVTDQPPGSGRLADLAAYYQDPTNEGVSPFNEEE